MHADATSANRAVLERWIDIVKSGDMSEIPSVWAPDLVLHAGAGGHGLGEAHGYEGMGAVFGPFAVAFPDAQLEVLHMVGEGDLMAGFYRITATHSGSYFGIAPTGKSIEFHASGIYRFEDGLIAEAWAMDDGIGLLDQLGVLPVAGSDA